MNYIAEKEEILLQSLSESGCRKGVMEHAIHLYQEASEQELYLLLKNQKQELLRELHSIQKRIDSLDYLVYQLEKKQL